jgi:hypothetical protein
VHQQVAIDDATGDVYATQVISGGQTIGDETEPVSFEDRARRGDFAINRISADGAILGVMYVRGFDHGAGLGVQHVGGQVLLWTGYDAEEAEPGADGYARRLARFAFDPGAVLDVGDPAVTAYDPRPTADHITASVDEANDQIGLRYHRNGTYFITVYRLSTFTPDDFGEVLYAERSIPVAAAFQSWVLYQEFAYTWHGRAGERLYFTVYSLPDAGVVREITNNQYPNLTYREAEGVAVLHSGTPGAVIAWGVATGGAGNRLINLYAAQPTPESSIVARTVTDGVELTVRIDNPSTVTLWQVVRRPDGTVLFSGDGTDIPPEGPAVMVDTSPLRCTDISYELRVVRGEEQTLVTSNVVQYIPPEGCGPAGAVSETPQSIGCPTRYRTAIHWRGGALQFPLQMMDQLTECAWARTLNDASEATATYSRDVFGSCCNEVQDIHPWTHELTVYRELPGERPEIVWQGPIQRVRVQRERIIIEAMDVFAWLEHLVNTWRMQYTTVEPDDVGRRRGTVVYIAQNIIKLNMIDSTLSEPDDYAGLYQYIETNNEGLSVIQWRRDGYEVDDSVDPPEIIDRQNVWTEYVSNILRELEKSGLRWTTVGRTLYLRSQSTASSLPTARLDFADFSGETEIIRDGTEAATRGFATSRQGEDLEGETVSVGRVETPYGRLDRLVNVQEDEPSTAQLRRVAANEVSGRYPAPMAISMPGNAQLAPEAAITVRQLVPGERVDVLGDDCFLISQGFLLTDVDAQWDNTAGEKLSVGLTTLPATEEEGGPT